VKKYNTLIKDDLYTTEKLCREETKKNNDLWKCSKTKCDQIKYVHYCKQVKLPLKEFLKIKAEVPK